MALEEKGATRINKEYRLADVFTPTDLSNKAWVCQDTAILVFHGVGNQNPLETLDTFARGLLKAFVEYGSHDQQSLTLSHHLAKKPTGDNTVWFDNYIRITCSTTNTKLDIYEYYWANYTQDRVKMTDMQDWVESVAKGANDFYEQEKFVEQHGDRSFFTKKGQFRKNRYKWTLKIAIIAIPFITKITEGCLNVLRTIPLIGPFAYTGFQKLQDTCFGLLTNIAGDVVVYNSTDVKKELCQIRKRILLGAVKALRYLIEPKLDSKTNQKKFVYEKVVVAAHSLGSQVSFDAFNKLSHLIAHGEIEGVDRDGCLLSSQTDKPHISKLLSGYATFGCPLDKIAFFFRERSPENAFLKRQMMAHFHCFKEKDWQTTLASKEFKLNSTLPRYFQDITWRNYYDTNDAVSGHLDYYDDVVNLNCCFVKRQDNKRKGFLSSLYPFTHSNYWDHPKMYGDIIVNLLLK